MLKYCPKCRKYHRVGSNIYAKHLHTEIMKMRSHLIKHNPRVLDAFHDRKEAVACAKKLKEHGVKTRVTVKNRYTFPTYSVVTGR